MPTEEGVAKPAKVLESSTLSPGVRGAAATMKRPGVPFCAALAPLAESCRAC